MYQPTIMLSPRLAPLLGVENPDYDALFMMWGGGTMKYALQQISTLVLV